MLRQLPTKMVEYNSNITKFNEFVTTQVSELASRGETAEDLINTLFEAYKAADDPNFVQYIKYKESLWEENQVPDMTAHSLMNIADDKFKTMVTKSEWKGGTPGKSPAVKESDLVSFQSTMEAMVKQATKKQRAARTTQFTGKWAWKAIAPKGNEPRTKEFEKKKYIACANHPPAQWVLAEGHRDGCRLDPKNKPQATPAPQVKKPTPDAKTLSYMKALMSVFEGDHEDGDKDETPSDEKGNDAEEENV
jgi:hypothetical protein